MGLVLSKTGENDKLRHFIEHYPVYEEEFKAYRFHRENLRNILIMLFLLIPAALRHLIPYGEDVVLVMFVVTLSFLWGSFNYASGWIMKLYVALVFKKKNIDLLMFESHQKPLQESILEVLTAGTENYERDLLLKFRDKIAGDL